MKYETRKNNVFVEFKAIYTNTVERFTIYILFLSYIPLAYYFDTHITILPILAGRGRIHSFK